MDLKQLKSQLHESRLLVSKLKNLASIEQKKTRKFVQILIRRHEEDRRNISRELHDEVSQLLTGVNFQLSVLKKEATKSDQTLQTKISNAQTMISDSVGSIHQFARELRPVILDDLGLIPALKTAIRDFSKMTEIPVEFITLNGISNLNCLNKTVLFRVAQESLINITKHASATKVVITLKKIDGCLRLKIHDNGKSFKVKTKYCKKKHYGIGIQGMQERVNMVQGQFSITSNPENGTTVLAIVPYLKDDL